jgi:hypothetical protein
MKAPSRPKYDPYKCMLFTAEACDTLHRQETGPSGRSASGAWRDFRKFFKDHNTEIAVVGFGLAVVATGGAFGVVAAPVALAAGAGAIAIDVSAAAVECGGPRGDRGGCGLAAGAVALDAAGFGAAKGLAKGIVWGAGVTPKVAAGAKSLGDRAAGVAFLSGTAMVFLVPFCSKPDCK